MSEKVWYEKCGQSVWAIGEEQRLVRPCLRISQPRHPLTLHHETIVLPLFLWELYPPTSPRPPLGIGSDDSPVVKDHLDLNDRVTGEAVSATGEAHAATEEEACVEAQH